jgi:uncharacterized membrane protein YdjX (TVP38/TMEM64 family)
MDRKKIAFAIAGIALYGGMFFLLYELFVNETRIIDLATDRAILGPALIILLHLVQSVVFFLPGSAVSISAGYAFGMVPGFILNLIGTTLGTFILFFLARKASHFFGYSKIVTIEMKYIKGIFRKVHSRRLAYLVSRGVPMIPGDVVTIFVASFTKNNFLEYFVFSTIGAMPKLILDTFTGFAIRQYGLFGLPTIITIAAIIVFLVIGFFWQRNLVTPPQKKRGKRKK